MTEIRAELFALPKAYMEREGHPKYGKKLYYGQVMNGITGDQCHLGKPFTSATKAVQYAEMIAKRFMRPFGNPADSGL